MSLRMQTGHEGFKQEYAFIFIKSLVVSFTMEVGFISGNWKVKQQEKHHQAKGKNSYPRV